MNVKVNDMETYDYNIWYPTNLRYEIERSKLYRVKNSLRYQTTEIHLYGDWVSGSSVIEGVLFDDIVTFKSQDVRTIAVSANRVVGVSAGQTFISVEALQNTPSPVAIEVTDDEVEVVALEAYLLTDVSFEGTHRKINNVFHELYLLYRNTFVNLFHY